MRLRIIYLVLIAFFVNQWNGYSQETVLEKKINIHQEKISIKSVFSILENKLKIQIGYSDDAVDASRIVSVKLVNTSLREVLRTLFPSNLYKFKTLNQKILIYKRRPKYTISGYVSEQISSEYLSNTSIYIPQLKTGTITNDYGFYSITIEEGSYSVLVSFEGYKNITKEIVLKDDMVINFELEIETQFLDEVIITSNNVAEKINSTQMSTERFNPAVFEDVPMILGEKDALKTLQLLPGVQSGNEGFAGFYVRGGAPDQNLIVLDEAIVYNSNHLFGFFSVFNGDAIKSAEIYKGGFPARFGGRLSSVVKMDTKNGNKEKIKGKVNIGLISSTLLLEGPVKQGKSSFMVSGRRTYLDLIVRPFQTDRVTYYFTDVNAKYHHVFSDKDKLYWSTYFGQDKFVEEDDNIDQRIIWNNLTSTLRWNHEFSNKLFSNTSLIFSNYKFIVSKKDNPAATFFETSSGINDYGIKFDLDYYPIPEHKIKLGLVSTFHDFTPRKTNAENPNDGVTSEQKIETLESGLYVEDDWKVSERLSLYPGLRISHFKHRSSTSLKPEVRFSAAYRMRSSLTFKASYAKMNQYIHRLSNTGLGLPTDLWISSTDRLKPQISEQVALGLVKNFDNNKYTLTIEGYYKKMNNIISFKEGVSFLRGSGLEGVDESIRNVDFVNGITSGQGWAYGSEFLLRKKAGKLTGWLGYTLSWSQRQFDLLNNGNKFNDQFDRRHDISIVGIYKPNKKCTLSASWTFSSGANYNVKNITGVNPENDFPIDSGQFFNQDDILFNIEKNNFRGESFHKLDLGIQFHKVTKRNRERTWGFSMYNAYGRKNPFYYEISSRQSDEESRFVLSKRHFFQFVPSFNYTLKF
ncbi:TonB-dependent receptor [uncultured Aquimarina sp.]|uniref:TonB-dependent receptor n=1 Tax=uncultured Aquimarina sp. TaxID=575652 RepID=UPI0026016965|nr:TonB-dependent receptor [uncultured Aquimarina sp.]